MVYKTSLDYHMATPNLPEIKSYVDSEQAQKIINQFKIMGGGGVINRLDNVSPYSSGDNLLSQFYPTSSQTNTNSNLSTNSVGGWFSKKTILLLVIFSIGFIFFYYYQYERIQWATNLAGYETQKIVDKIKFSQHINSAGEYVRKITGRILDSDESVLSPM